MKTICKLLADSHSDKHHIQNSNTNNGRLVHKYGPVYALILHTLYNVVQRPLKILEVGVATGASLVNWSEIEFVDRVVGIDPGMDPCVEFNKKIDYTKHDGYNHTTIEYLKNKYTNFDLIIDDGSHEWEHQQFFLENYYNLLSEQGILLCEDVYTSNLSQVEDLKDTLNLYILNLAHNINVDNNEVIVLRFKEPII